ncbi:MAG: glycosyltransferase [Leptospiraceae bacterium]|nr:glycosyltransferase [Leptospiraceae bacterium]
MQIITLQNFILKKLKDETINSLFHTTIGEINFSESIELTKDSIISFETYFNSLDISTWKKSGVEQFSLELQFQGDLEISLFHRIPFEKKLLSKHELNATNKKKVSLPIQNLESFNGYVFPEIVCNSPKAKILKIRYLGSVERVNEVRVAICICTFKREEYVMRNMKILETTIFKDPLVKNSFKVFISDNGRTLKNEFKNHKNILVFPNINSGGAGGFTRGLIEASKDNFQPTHILFMDDDVLFEEETFYRLKNLLSILKDQFVGGAFFVYDEPNIQYEAGAIWKMSGAIPQRHKLDMKKPTSLLSNLSEPFSSYNGWWFSCFPISTFKDGKNFPYPFFIKGDDMEFGLRNKKEWVFLNGISVWHESLEKKYSDMTAYYFIRNYSIVNSIHFDSFRILRILFFFIKEILREILSFKYNTAKIICMGMEHFLEGPEFLKNSDPEENNKLVREKCYKLGTGIIPYKAEFSLAVENRISPFKLLKMIFTLNGHFFPSSRTNAIVVNAQKYELSKIHNKNVVYYLDQVSSTFFKTELNTKELMIILKEVIKIVTKIIMNFGSLKKAYRKSLNEFSNEEFWKKYLRL